MATKSHTLFDGVDLILEPGNIYGLLGLNGAGKSTLLRLLSGLIFPQSGRIRVLDKKPGLRAPELLSRIYMLSETPHLPADFGPTIYLKSRTLLPGFRFR